MKEVVSDLKSCAYKGCKIATLKKYVFFLRRILPYQQDLFGIGATIRVGREMLCLLYAGFPSSKQPLNLQTTILRKEIKGSLIYLLSGRTAKEISFLYRPAQKSYPHGIVYKVCYNSLSVVTYLIYVQTKCLQQFNSSI